MADYQHTLHLKADPEKVFVALTREVSLWWTSVFEGSSIAIGDTFTVRFGEGIFKTLNISQLIQQQSLTWEVKEALIDIPQLQHQAEWKGTTIHWAIAPSETGTLLVLTHFGLNPALECYTICSEGWQQFLHSLQCHIETGKGKPFQLTTPIAV